MKKTDYSLNIKEFYKNTSEFYCLKNTAYEKAQECPKERSQGSKHITPYIPDAVKC